MSRKISDIILNFKPKMIASTWQKEKFSYSLTVNTLFWNPLKKKSFSLGFRER